MNKTNMSENTKDSLRRGADLQEKVSSTIKTIHYKYSLLLECVSRGGHLSDVIFFHTFKNSPLRFTCCILQTKYVELCHMVQNIKSRRLV